MTSAQPPSQALIPAHDRAPAAYGGRGEVRALATRIMAIHPAARQIGERGALLLAQLGVALGLNPLPGTGHIHAWMDDGQLCIHIGLEGRLALARNESTFSYTTRPMRAEEAQEHDLQPGDRGAIAELTRHDLAREELALRLPLSRFVGVGIVRARERVPKGRSLAWRATQRAIKDSIRQAFSFSLPGDLAGQIHVAEDESEIPSEVINGQATEADGPERAQGAPGTAESALGQAEDAHGGTAAMPGAPEAESGGDGQQPAQIAQPYSPAFLRETLAKLAQKHAERPATPKQRGLVASMLEECFVGDEDADRQRHTVAAWLFGHASVNELAPGQIHAALDWLKPTKDSGGAYAPDSMAAREARAALTQALLDAGQMPLGLSEQAQKAAND